MLASARQVSAPPICAFELSCATQKKPRLLKTILRLCFKYSTSDEGGGAGGPGLGLDACRGGGTSGVGGEVWG